MKFFRKIPGKVRFTLRGLNIEKFLNHIISSGYNLAKINRIEHGKVSFVVPFKDSDVVKSEAEKYGFEVCADEVFGAYKIVDFIVKRFACIVAMIICFCVYLFSNLFVWSVNISGNYELSKADIMAALQLENYGIGRPKANVNIKQVEQVLLNKFDQIALVSAYLYGNSLNINISEKLPQNYLDYSLMSSEYNGIIKEFTLVSGTAAVKVGDVVRVGDVLVYPYIIDNSGEKKSISAQANIVIEVDFSYTIRYNENREIYEDSGRKFVVKNISLGKLNFRKTKPCPYKNYRQKTNESYVLNNMFLPIKKTEIVYYEQVLVSKFIAFEKAKDDLIKEAYEKAVFEAKNFEILDKKHTIVKGDDLYYITATIKAMVYIGDKLWL